MTKREELLALAERVEGLSGPDREVDIAIHDSLGIKGGWSGPFHPSDRPRGIFTGPAYTASLDAAMSLVPEDWERRDVGMMFWPQHPDEPRAGEIRCQLWRGGKRYAGYGVDIPEAIAATHALALTAAALRSLAEQEGEAPQPQPLSYSPRIAPQPAHADSSTRSTPDARQLGPAPR